MRTEPESTVSEYDVVLLLDRLALELAKADSFDLGFFGSLLGLCAFAFVACVYAFAIA